MTFAIIAIIMFAAVWILALFGLVDTLKVLGRYFNKAPKAKPTPFRPYCLGPRYQNRFQN